MATLVNRYVIRHLTGTKANQVEEFDYKKHNELTFGRAATNVVRFDPERDSAVSREHGKIVRESGKQFVFTLVDNNSRNGIFVNKSRIAGSTQIQPGDEIQLGQGGPVFQFDLNPRPAELMMSTRVVDIPESFKPTTELMLTEPVGGSQENDLAMPPKVGLGKQTVERMMNTERRKTNKSVFLSVSALLVLLSGLAFMLKDKIKPETVHVHHHEKTEVVKAANNGLSAEQIASTNTSKIVFIEFGYKLIHTNTGDDIYHEYMPIKLPDGRIVNKAIYIETAQGKIEPLLGLKRNVAVGKPIAMAGASGTGFVVSPQGHIMTNRHVAAAWNSYYSFPQDAFPGILLVEGAKGWEISAQPVQEFRWVPSETQFFGKKPMSGKLIEGVNTYMDVTFNKNEQRFPAEGKPIVSSKHDVALIKIGLAETLTPVKLRDADKTIAPGQPITVMGYPGISPDVYVGEYSSDFSNRNPQIVKVPDVTVTPGNIGKILRGQTMGKAAAYYSEFGDYYQLTANATGAGNSGGPVFDNEGNAIGIFSASTSRDDATRITFAIPIKYGLELMGRRQVVE
ncbi:trypsin-like peptidase domain-containing protein [Spirosoma sp. BT702]|uniref:Trypsin-like peptidase domain-containing protein n=1 Tax=Spirosoma profusum TaxID=2771354 RepID=A0A926XYK0_9BACT|nr:trypsin-like peptidase domain-containing protein [Spirosoma profusum]MBD2700457.1 trypsin-like peptidase domain-containing protein [Spirosoma profusum]